MIVGVLKEIKAEENRVSMTPPGVEMIKNHGHTVLVEKEAGKASGFSENDYKNAGAEIISDPREIYKRSEMVMHVKEPLPSEYGLLEQKQIVFTFFHLAASEELTRAMVKSGAVCIAYETIQKKDNSLPLLIPMSEVAGRMSVHEAARCLEMAQGGAGLLIGGVPGVEPATVLILGGGTAGTHAARMACGLGAKVYLLDSSLTRLRYLSEVMPPSCFLLMSNPPTIQRLVREADVVIGAVLIPGSQAPKLVTRDMIAGMKKGSVLIDISIDQGGCFETSRPTTHDKPTFVAEGIVHYCVANMPGAVARTSTYALTNATISYALEIAEKGWKKACRENSEIMAGVNVANGKITYKGVADAFGMEYVSIEQIL